MSVLTAFWILLAANIILAWMLDVGITKRFKAYNDHLEREIGYLQTKLGIDDATKKLMDEVDAAKEEF